MTVSILALALHMDCGLSPHACVCLHSLADNMSAHGLQGAFINQAGVRCPFYAHSRPDTVTWDDPDDEDPEDGGGRLDPKYCCALCQGRDYFCPWAARRAKRGHYYYCEKRIFPNAGCSDAQPPVLQLPARSTGSSGSQTTPEPQKVLKPFPVLKSAPEKAEEVREPTKHLIMRPMTTEMQTRCAVVRANLHNIGHQSLDVLRSQIHDVFQLRQDEFGSCKRVVWHDIKASEDECIVLLLFEERKTACFATTKMGRSFLDLDCDTSIPLRVHSGRRGQAIRC